MISLVLAFWLHLAVQDCFNTVQEWKYKENSECQNKAVLWTQFLQKKEFVHGMVSCASQVERIGMSLLQLSHYNCLLLIVYMVLW